MNEKIKMRIKNWYNDFKGNREHNKKAKYFNKELEQRYYKPKSETKDKLLCEIYNKAGLSSFDIVPILFKLKYLHPKGVMVEKESGARNAETVSDFLKNLENLGLIKIVENNFYSYAEGRKFITSMRELKIIVHLLPKGIDYIKEYKNKIFEKRLKIILALFAFSSLCISFWNLSKPNKREFNKLEKKLDSVSVVIEKMKEKPQAFELKQLKNKK